MASFRIFDISLRDSRVCLSNELKKTITIFKIIYSARIANEVIIGFMREN